MYTQCPKCETVFRLSAEALRAAGGQVRCGRCGGIFNALTRLAEEPAAFRAAETPLELETRADAILQAGAPSPPAGTGAPDEAGELAEELEASMEFTLPPGELDRIFVDSHAHALGAESLETLVICDSEPAPEPVPSTGLEVPEHVRRDLMAVFDQATGGAGAAADGAPRVARTMAAESAGAAPMFAAGAVAADVGEIVRPRRRSRLLWPGAAVLLALALGLQIVVDRREWLEARTPFGDALRALGAQLGLPTPEPANLAAYQLRQWGVTGDPQANGTLHVRASILNTSAQPLAFPLLRVTLLNRFGTRLGSRDFQPAEYLGHPATRRLAPGERADATLAILDPGKDAEGFEIDVCLRGADGRVACAADAAPPGAR